MNDKFVSIIVPCFNGKKWIDVCLQHLLAIDYNHFEIIFVDNGSLDGSSEYIKENYNDPRLKTKRIEKNRGFTGGNNFGVKFAKGEFLLFVSIDVAVRKDILKKLVGSYTQSTGLISPIVLNEDILSSSFSPEKDVSINEAKLLTIDLFGYASGSSSKLFYIEGCIFLVKKDIFLNLDGFDEEYVTYYEDVDLSWRVMLLGYKNEIETESVAFHYGGSTSTQYFTPKQRKIETTYYRRYNTIKNMIRSTLKNYSLLFVLCILPIQISLFFCEGIYYLFFQRNIKQFKMVFDAIIWNINNIQNTLSCRRIIQNMRKKSDFEIIKKMHKYPTVIFTFIKNSNIEYVK